jgi:predicted nucleic acid-binding protein
MTHFLLDTNVLARYLIGDVQQQQHEAAALFAKAQDQKVSLHIEPATIIELNYVLTKLYYYPKPAVVSILNDLLSLGILLCDKLETILSAINIHKDNSVGLEDSYYIQLCLEKDLDFYSFDKKALALFKKLKRAKSAAPKK